MDTATGSPVLIRAFRLALTVEGLRPRTVQNYVSSAQQFAVHLGDKPLRGVKPSDIREFTVTAQGRLAAKTVHELQLGIRRFFRFLLQEGEVRRDPTREMKLVRYRVVPQPTYTEAEVKRLLMVCNPRTRNGSCDPLLELRRHLLCGQVEARRLNGFHREFLPQLPALSL